MSCIVIYKNRSINTLTFRMAAGVTHLVASFIVPHLVEMNGHEGAPTPSHGKHATAGQGPGARAVVPDDHARRTLQPLPVDILAVVHDLQQLLLTHVLHHHHGADPEDVGEAKVEDAVCRTVVSTWRSTDGDLLSCAGTERYFVLMGARRRVPARPLSW